MVEDHKLQVEVVLVEDKLDLNSKEGRGAFRCGGGYYGGGGGQYVNGCCA